MIFPNEKRRVQLRFPAGILCIALFLAGCAEASSTASPSKDSASNQEGHIVDGQGTSQDRTVISNFNQQIFDAEHPGSPGAPAAPPSAPSQVQNNNLP
ncbi:MAG: hypothetical protein LV480_11765 [Methylacidiphilales bacterium]|nr:hypothetical protein [Candidatus Methylacidiphilales bacterium]